jgi:tRNA pseudouridine13 synthase
LCGIPHAIHLRKLSKQRTYVYLHFFRGVVAEFEDVIKAAVDGLGKNGFINYYGLQVQNQELLLVLKNLFHCYF